MVEPFSAAYLLIDSISGGFIGSSIVNQLGRIFFADKSAKITIEQRQKELAAIESRFIHELKERRDLKIMEIQQQFNNSIAVNNHEWRMQRWPLVIQPMDIVQRSVANTSVPLNIIFTITPIRRAEFDSVFELLARPLKLTWRRSNASFGGDVIFYDELRRESRHSGEGLQNTLWNLLQTEATVLIEADVDGDLITLDICHWGAAFASSGSATSPIVTHNPITIDLSSLSVSATDQRQRVLEFGLSSIVTLLGDVYRALQRPHGLLAPVFPPVMGAVPESAWKPMNNVYLATYDMVASHSPQIASELAAKASLTAYEANQRAFAEMLLDKALELFRKTVAVPIALDEDLMDELAMVRNGSIPLQLERALWTMRGLKFGKNDGSVHLTLSDIAQMGITRAESDQPVS